MAGMIWQKDPPATLYVHKAIMIVLSNIFKLPTINCKEAYQITKYKAIKVLAWCQQILSS